MSRQDEPLKNRTIALSEHRELDALAALLEGYGARTIRCPLVAILDVPPGPVEEWLRLLAGERFDELVLYTGEGLRRLLACAERAGLRDEVVAAIARVRTVTRGPKPARALREIGRTPDLRVRPPTTAGIIETYSGQMLDGRRIGVQLYPSENEPALIGFLKSAGATVHAVTPYRYAPASASGAVLALIEQLASGTVDVLAFTSASQVDRLWDVASACGQMHRLAEALGRVKIAAVGPIAADAVRGHGAAVAIQPERSFAMSSLANAIIAAFAAPDSA